MNRQQRRNRCILLIALLVANGVAWTYLFTLVAFESVPATARSLPTARVVPIAARVRARKQPPPGSPSPTQVLYRAPIPTPTRPPLLAPTLTSTPVPLPAITNPVDAQPVLLLPTPAPAAEAAPPESAPSEDAASAAGIPILMYHYIRSVDRASDELGYNLSVAPEVFAQHMAWLHDNGYATIRMDTLTRCLRGEQHCPAQAVALTFDDGYSDAYSAVLPVLQSYGFIATFYIASDFVGQPGYMNWQELAALQAAGMEIGAHSVSHVNLTTLNPADAEWQIIQSKVVLEQQLGIVVTSFCYPSGQYNAAIAGQVSAAGYANATTTRWDLDVSDLFALPRRRVAGGTSVESFAAIVRGY